MPTLLIFHPVLHPTVQKFELRGEGPFFRHIPPVAACRSSSPGLWGRLVQVKIAGEAPTGQKQHGIKRMEGCLAAALIQCLIYLLQVNLCPLKILMWQS